MQLHKKRQAVAHLSRAAYNAPLDIICQESYQVTAGGVVKSLGMAKQLSADCEKFDGVAIFLGTTPSNNMGLLKAAVERQGYSGTAVLVVP